MYVSSPENTEKKKKKKERKEKKNLLGDGCEEGGN